MAGLAEKLYITLMLCLTNNCIKFIFVTSVVSLVGIGTFLHKMGEGGYSVFEGLTSALFFYRVRRPFRGFLCLFPRISLEKP